MIQLRWKVEEWDEFTEFFTTRKRSDPVLQYRTIDDPAAGYVHESSRTDWKDVETEYVEI